MLDDEWVFVGIIEISSVFRTQTNIYDEAFIAEIIKRVKP